MIVGGLEVIDICGHKWFAVDKLEPGESVTFTWDDGHPNVHECVELHPHDSVHRCECGKTHPNRRAA